LLPASVREFGLVPDFNQCLPGDLILFRDVAQSRTSRLIAGAQTRAGFAPEHSCWTHAAIFLYADFIVEAVPWPGIKTRTLYSDIPRRMMRVRRDISLSDIQRYEIALRALRMLGTRYSWITAISIGMDMFKGLWNSDSQRPPYPVVICSKAFYDAYADVTHKLLQGCQAGGPVLPAHLSSTTDLSDVDIGWVRLA
jgi:hypothetical protein